MKLKITTMFLALSLLLVFFVPITARAFSLGIDPKQGTVGTEVTIPAMCNYGSGDYRPCPGLLL